MEADSLREHLGQQIFGMFWVHKASSKLQSCSRAKPRCAFRCCANVQGAAGFPRDAPKGHDRVGVDQQGVGGSLCR